MTETKAPQTIWTASNVITLLRILLVPVFVAALLAPWPEWFGMAHIFNDQAKCLVAAAIFVLISITDWLDGYLARSRNEITDFGKFMDPLADKILVAAALICLVELDSLPSWVVLIILAREFIVSGVRMMAASKGVVIAASMLGKFKTVFQMIAIVLFTLKGSHMNDSIETAITDPFWVFSWVIMLIALGLTIASLVDYLVKAKELFGFFPSKSKKTSENLSLNEVVETALEDLASTIIEKALEQQATISTAESLTGGMIGETLTAIPGSSAVYKGGIVSYTNAIKHHLLDVSHDILNSDGAVSEKCALAMAKGAQKTLDTTIAISVTGIAGPGGAEEGKPVGTVWIGLSTATKHEAVLYEFQGDRNDVRRQTTYQALRLVLSEL